MHTCVDTRMKGSHQGLKKEGKDQAAEEVQDTMKVGQNKEKELKTEEVQTEGRDQEVEKSQVVVKEDQVCYSNLMVLLYAK